MTTMIRLAVSAGVLGLAACADANPVTPLTDVPVAISWMEWPAAVTPVAPGAIRLRGGHSLCGTFELGVEQSSATHVSVTAVEHIPAGAVCPAVIALFDTVIPLPVLAPQTAGPTTSFIVDAEAYSLTSGIQRRPFGAIMLAQAPDTARQAGGRVHLLSDSLGCSWMRSELLTAADVPQVLSSDVTLGAQWVPAFVTGFFAEAFSPRCGHTRVFQVTAAEVELTP